MLLQSELLSILNKAIGQKAHLRKGGSQATYHCPFCPDKNLITTKLEVAIDGSHIGNYHCWRCGEGGKSFGTLLKKLNAPDHYRQEIFKLTGDIRISKKYHIVEQFSIVSLPPEFNPIINPSQTLDYRHAVAYLKRRGITREDVIRYNIGYCENGEYADHIIFPSYDSNGNLNFFIGRRYYADDPGIPHKKPDVSMNLVGFENLINWNEPINLCEGVFDAIAIRNNAIPLFGKYPSKKLQESMVYNKTTRVNILLDNDALTDAIKICKLIMKLGIDVYLVHLNEKDPSSTGFKKIHSLIREAKQFTEEDLLRHALKL